MSTPALSAAKQALLEARLRGDKAPALRPPGADAAPIPRRAPGAPAPLSFQQERLWSLNRLQAGLPVYNLPGALRIAGPLDVDAAERALGEVLRRHEVLRTTFREVDGAPVQVIHPFTGFTLAVDDVSGLDEGELRRVMLDDAARPFSLAEGPLFRARLLRKAEGEHVLLLCMHHAVTDGWSGGVLMRELSTLYAAFRDGRPSPLPELPIQYADYAAWQREHLRGPALQRDLAWWKQTLAGVPARLRVPADHPRPPARSFRGATEPVALPPEFAERVEALGRAEGATVFMVLLAAFQVLLSRYGAGDDVVVGSPVAGRTRRELEGLIGLFANTLVLRTDLSGDPPFREVLRRVRATVLGAYEHQDVPFEKLVAELGVERSLGHAPVVQAVLIVQNSSATDADSPVQKLEVETGAARMDLTLTLWTGPRGIYGGLEYATDLFEPATIRRLIGNLGRVLEQAVADPGIRLSALERMDDGERDPLLHAGTGPGTAPGPDPDPDPLARPRRGDRIT